MESKARVKGNLRIAHAAVAEPDGILHRVTEPRLAPVVRVCLGCSLMEGLGEAAKWLIGGVECGVDGWERTHTAPDIARSTDRMLLLGGCWGRRLALWMDGLSRNQPRGSMAKLWMEWKR